jgi:hypothetical protein
VYLYVECEKADDEAAVPPERLTIDEEPFMVFFI